MINPFVSSQSLAEWAKNILVKRDVDSLARWRMLEHWMQPELYRAAELGNAGSWRHLGEGEQPYYTAQPRKTSAFEVKWIDLVFAQPNLEKPKQIIWFELKHIGRSQERLKTNAADLGNDTAALYTLDPVKTRDVWLNPPTSVKNASKVELWNRYGPGIATAEHYFAQVVLVQKRLVDVNGNDALIKNAWLKAFERRTNLNPSNHGLHIARADTAAFSLFALVGRHA